MPRRILVLAALLVAVMLAAAGCSATEDDAYMRKVEAIVGEWQDIVNDGRNAKLPNDYEAEARFSALVSRAKRIEAPPDREKEHELLLEAMHEELLAMQARDRGDTATGALLHDRSTATLRAVIASLAGVK